ncbi:MAG: hypothetical protein ACE5HX_02205 [bacterium]
MKFEKFGIRFYFKELSSVENETYKNHLENCGECKALIRELQFLEETYKSEITLQPQAEVVQEVLSKANSFVKNKLKKRVGYFRNPGISIRPLALGFLGLLIIIISTLFWFKKETSNPPTYKEEFTWQYSLDESFNTIQVSMDQIINYHENTFLFSRFEYSTFDNRLSDIKLGIESLNFDLKKNSF